MTGATRRFLTAVLALPLAGALGACSDLMTTPAASAGTATLTFSLVPDAAVAGMDADAFARADNAAVRVSQGQATTLDSVVAVSGSGDRTIQLAVGLQGAGGSFDIAVDLRSAQQALFQGQATAELSRGHRTVVTMTLDPVAAGLALPDSLPVMTALGDTLEAGGAVIFATGDTITGLRPTWSPSQGGVVTVDSTGLVRAVTEGTATLVASYGGFSGVTHVRVQAVVDSVIPVDSQSVTDTLLVGHSLQLHARAIDRNGNPLVRTITWTSSDTTIASVDTTGQVTGLTSGTVEITGTADGKHLTFTIHVLQIPIASVEVLPSSRTLAVGDSASFTAYPKDANGNVLTDRICTWSTNDPKVVLMFPVPGLVQLITALGLGSATVSATCEGVVGEARVDVVQPSIGVSPTSVTINAILGTNPPPAMVSVFNAAGAGTLDGLSVAVAFPPADVPYGWITATLNSSTAPTTIAIQVDATVVYPGTFLATVTVSAAGTPSVVIPVTVIVADTLIVGYGSPGTVPGVGAAPVDAGPASPFDLAASDGATSFERWGNVARTAGAGTPAVVALASGGERPAGVVAGGVTAINLNGATD